jgi:hypothetical protein
MKNIAFWDNQLGERGTTIALYDYAYYNQSILKNKSFIFYDKNCQNNNLDVIKKFEKQFKVYGVNNFNEVDQILLKNDIEIIYIQKSGELDNRISKVAKNCIHCVFNSKEPHGNVYASISQWVKKNDGKFPVVPHIVDLPDNTTDMRQQLNIPSNAVVFGRHGGYEQFNIKKVHKVVFNVASKLPNIYFVFVNTKPFCNPLPNIIHIDKIIDLNEKVKFINTCDAMLWARADGETFGLAIAEFSIKNKPVICTKYINCGDIAHIHLLGDKAILYKRKFYQKGKSLNKILTNFNKEEVQKKDWNAYREYSPEKVMQTFKKVFIDA